MMESLALVQVKVCCSQLVFPSTFHLKEDYVQCIVGNIESALETNKASPNAFFCHITYYRQFDLFNNYILLIEQTDNNTINELNIFVLVVASAVHPI